MHNQLGTVSCSQSCVRQRAAGAQEPCRAWLLPSEAEPQLPWEQSCSPAPASSFSAPQLICHCPPSTEAQKQTPLNRETSSTGFSENVSRERIRELFVCLSPGRLQESFLSSDRVTSIQQTCYFLMFVPVNYKHKKG